MNLWGRKCSPRPTPPPSWLLPLPSAFETCFASLPQCSLSFDHHSLLMYKYFKFLVEILELWFSGSAMPSTNVHSFNIIHSVTDIFFCILHSVLFIHIFQRRKWTSPVTYRCVFLLSRILVLDPKKILFTNMIVTVKQASFNFCIW